MLRVTTLSLVTDSASYRQNH